MSVAELTRLGFHRSPVLMANEAHDGMARCVRTRRVGCRIVRAAHEVGVRRLAMETLPWPGAGVSGPIRAVPEPVGGYLAQPDMQELLTTALDLGWTLWAYEAVIDFSAHDPERVQTLEFTNWREHEQARNLRALIDGAPGEPLLVWCGNDHATKAVCGDWVPMGHHFTTMDGGAEAFVIDQTMGVEWPGETGVLPEELLASLAPMLSAHGGTAGILREQAPAPLDLMPGVNAFILSTDNRFG